MPIFTSSGQFQQRDEMQRASEDQISGKWIEPQVGFPRIDAKPQLMECVMPFGSCPVIVWQENAVACISYPIR
jgi:hypothetical protein